MYARTFKNAVSAAAILTLSVLASGCGTDITTAPNPESNAPRALTLPSSEQTQPTTFKAGRGPAISVLVSAEQGGTVRLGRYQLDFPPGALTEDTEISIRQSHPNTMTLELGPHGIQFAKPVRLSFKTDGISIDEASTTLGVSWFNESSSTWEPISHGPVSAPKVSADLWHFSDYGVFQQ
ncbi:MAG: hypothetical protein FD129_492 [bacterium]|nr:MAG: hypothetical protein FD129_492 [bacterium]